jgi:hypothetical protein
MLESETSDLAAIATGVALGVRVTNLAESEAFGPPEPLVVRLAQSMVSLARTGPFGLLRELASRVTDTPGERRDAALTQQLMVPLIGQIAAGAQADTQDKLAWFMANHNCPLLKRAPRVMGFMPEGTEDSEDDEDRDEDNFDDGPDGPEGADDR